MNPCADERTSSSISHSISVAPRPSLDRQDRLRSRRHKPRKSCVCLSGWMNQIAREGDPPAAKSPQQSSQIDPRMRINAAMRAAAKKWQTKRSKRTTSWSVLGPPGWRLPTLCLHIPTHR
ncbi:protein of unknown function [Pararobbsia alpina]